MEGKELLLHLLESAVVKFNNAQLLISEYDSMLGMSGRTDLYIIDSNGRDREVEIKVSMHDLTKLEMEKEKWKWGEQYWNNKAYQKENRVPAYFYFCIPEEIAEKSIVFIKENFPSFVGIIVVEKVETSIFGVFEYKARSVRSARRIHDYEVSEKRRRHVYKMLSLRWKDLKIEKLKVRTQ